MARQSRWEERDNQKDNFGRSWMMIVAARQESKDKFFLL